MWETPFGSRNDNANDGHVERMNQRSAFRKKKNRDDKNKSTKLPPLIKNRVEEEQKEESPVKHQVAETSEEAQKRFENIFAN